MLAKLLKPTIDEAIKNKDFRALKEGLLGIPAPDLAEMLAELEEPSRSIVFRLLPRQLMTEVFEFLPVEVQEELLTTLGTETTRHLLENMSPDDRTQLLEELPAELVKRLMGLLSPEERRLATSLLVFPEDSVGRMMTPEYIELKPDMTAQEALQHIRETGLDKETIYSSYVTDEKGHLLGRVSLRSLVLAPPDTKVKDLVDKHCLSVTPQTDREEAIRLCQKYDLLAVPVVDEENKLVGIVTIDDIMDVKDEEVTEDIHKMAAVLPTEEAYLRVSPFKMVWRRVIWLFILLVAETIAGKLIKNYESLISRNIWLPIFIPILVATGGNTGSQAAVMVIRALALGELNVSDFFKAILKQVYTGVLLALALCPLMFLIAIVLQSDPVHSAIVAASLTLIVTAANVVGTALPLFFKAIGLDPALMSGPFISTIMDIIGIFIYFHIALYLEHLL